MCDMNFGIFHCSQSAVLNNAIVSSFYALLCIDVATISYTITALV